MAATVNDPVENNSARSAIAASEPTLLKNTTEK